MDSITLPGKRIENALAEAAYLVFDGPTALARALGVTQGAVSSHLATGFVNTRGVALRLAEVCAEAGCPIPPEEFLALRPWGGLNRHPDLAGRASTRRRRSAPAQDRTGTTVPADAAVAYLTSRLTGACAA